MCSSWSLLWLNDHPASLFFSFLSGLTQDGKQEAEGLSLPFSFMFCILILLPLFDLESHKGFFYFYFVYFSENLCITALAYLEMQRRLAKSKLVITVYFSTLLA